MEPFSIPDPLRDLIDSYPAPRRVLDAANRGGEQARIALVRLWLSEGIPHAFHKCPAVYESVRTWLSAMLNVHAKEIGMVGSARLGASLAPQKLGEPFSKTSDLDFFVVSKSLFEKVKEEFCQWSLDFESGVVTPRNAAEETHWKSNAKRGPGLIARGFLDPKKMIPNTDRYPETAKIINRMWVLVEKLRRTPSAPRPKEASVRCYMSWDSFVRQTSLNLSKGVPAKSSAWRGEGSSGTQGPD